MVETNKKIFPFKLRLMALLPLIFFSLHLVHHYKQRAPSNMLWMCNISNFTLCLGLLLGISLVIRVSVLWLVVGFPLWIIDLLQFGQTPLTTFFVHIGGGFVGLYALKHIKFEKNIWAYAFGWYLIVQQFCRMYTLSSLNINLAHNSRELLNIKINNYFLYWIITCLLAAILLFIFSFILSKAFPSKSE